MALILASLRYRRSYATLDLTIMRSVGVYDVAIFFYVEIASHSWLTRNTQ